MGNITPITLWGPVQLTASAAVLGSAVAANTIQIVKQAVFTNTDTANRTITVYVVRSGGSAGATDILIDAQVLSPGQAYPAPELANLVLNAGDAVYALADVASKVNAVASGFQQ